MSKNDKLIVLTILVIKFKSLKNTLFYIQM